MNNIAPKLQNAGYIKLASKSYKKMPKQPNFFHSQPKSTLSKDSPAKFYLSATFGLSCSVAPTRSHILLPKSDTVTLMHFMSAFLVK